LSTDLLATILPNTQLRRNSMSSESFYFDMH
jgi:hypothetical protein